MAVKPKDCVNATINLYAKVAELEEKIDKKLMDNYRFSKIITMNLGTVNTEVLEIVVKRFKDAGWSIKIDKVGRQNNEICLSFSA